jgi:hypothetical protein
MSDTPEIDSFTHSVDETPLDEWVYAGHAMRLERERDEASKDAFAASELHLRRFGTLKAEFDAVRRDRDELRKKLDDSDIVMKRAASKVEELNKGIIRLVTERNQAREIAHLAHDLDKVTNALNVLIGFIPKANCCDLHHKNKDKHTYDKPCPAVARHTQRIDAAMKLLAKELHLSMTAEKLYISVNRKN